jgi:hypothetical protein
MSGYLWCLRQEIALIGVATRRHFQSSTRLRFTVEDVVDRLLLAFLPRQSFPPHQITCPTCQCQERPQRNRPSRASCNTPKLGEVCSSSTSTRPSQLQTTNTALREPTPFDSPRNSRRGPTCSPFPDAAHALSTNPPLQLLPQHQRFQD